jgi:hypothetical protein
MDGWGIKSMGHVGATKRRASTCLALGAGLIGLGLAGWRIWVCPPAYVCHVGDVHDMIIANSTSTLMPRSWELHVTVWRLSL